MFTSSTPESGVWDSWIVQTALWALSVASHLNVFIFDFRCATAFDSVPTWIHFNKYQAKIFSVGIEFG